MLSLSLHTKKCELPRPEGRGFQCLAGLLAFSLICWFGGLTAPSITMRAMFMFAFCKKAFLTLLAILAVDGEVFSYKTYKTYKAYCILRLKGGTFGDKKEDRF
jgi:hypothetical protein